MNNGSDIENIDKNSIYSFNEVGNVLRKKLCNMILRISREYVGMDS
jgi:hypothetical protein